MAIEIRAPRAEDRRAVQSVVAAALLFPPLDDEGWERTRASWEEMVSIAAWDGNSCVGHVGHFLVDTTVPGGARLPTGAVSRVGVLPTHRRQRLATQLMQALIRRGAEDGLALMSLRASEGVIYERYGFGIAGEFTEAVFDPQRARPVRGAASGGGFRLLPPDEILSTLPDVYARHAHNRPGVITRPDSFWERYFRDAVTLHKASYVVVHTAASGEIDGFAHYDVAWNESESAQGGKGEVHDLFGASPAVELALWSYLFDIDLIREWRADELPLDAAVRYATADPRACTVKRLDDEQWLRLLDVDRALTTRTYNPAEGAVTIRVTDPLLEANNASWRVTAKGAEASADDADLVVDIATLSAAYLGGTSWHSLHARGSVAADSANALVVADTLFASRPLPFCGSFF